MDLLGSEVYNIVEETMLRDSTNSGSVVRAGVDGRHSVDSRREAGRNISTEDATDSRSVQPLEEREGERVEDLRRCKRLDLLNHNVGVRNQDALRVELLRCREVVLLGIREVSSIHVLDRN